MNLEQYWSGKRIVVTGASSGLGLAITKALSRYKAHFCLLSRRAQPMQQLAAELSATGSKFWIQSCDVRNRSEIENSIDQFAKEASGIDIAWINSGIARDSSFRNWDWEAFEETIDTNLKGAIYTTHACLKHMVPRNQGTIVGISSAAAMRGLPARGIYSVTKISLAYYMESMACELPQIQFTTIYPGYVDTPINQNNPNRFWLMTADRAAQLMISAVASGKKEYIYPLRMGLLFHLVRALPASVYRKIGNRNLEKASVNPKI